MSAPSIPANPLKTYSPMPDIREIVLNIPIVMTAGALFARVFTTLSPAAGAIIIGVTGLSLLAVRVIASCFTANTNYISGAGFVGGIALSHVVLKAAGFASLDPVKIVLLALGTFTTGMAVWVVAAAAMHVVQSILLKTSHK